MCNCLRNVACCITLFFPDKRALNNAKKINGLYKIIIDNTNDDDIDYEVRTDDNCRYIRLGTNHGVAFALNLAAHTAIESGYDWLLTLDQDSELSHDMLVNIISYARTYHFEKIGMITAVQVRNETQTRLGKHADNEVLIAMTSGSLLNLKAYQKCGSFEDKLFIDHVDHEYCLRLKRLGYKVNQCNNAILKHSIGAIINTNLFGYKYTITTHRPFRLYYFTRNGLYVAFKYIIDYPYFLIYFTSGLLKNIFKAIFIEDSKMERLKMICAGFSDFLKGRYGKKFN
jgi:rhamnosyltransferase